MRAADEGIDAAIDFDQAVEDGVAREPPAHDILDIDVMLAVGLAVVESESGQVDRKARSVAKRAAGRGAPAVERGELGFDLAGALLNVDAHVPLRSRRRWPTSRS